MNGFIIASFIIPAIVTVMLIGLMIKERDYLFPKNAGKNWVRRLWIKNEKRTIQLKNLEAKKKSDNNFLDFSGGSLGI